ncbi:hypothetical protein [Cellulosimicrobium cellulans]|uniref:hypothetical protein n=1 Tax=Cellulosimicrobium cellulans TaxID=1710 RepID=UPI00130E27B0|nr:hypothetical protein [Cellulosimicrobium cellulans]
MADELARARRTLERLDDELDLSRVHLQARARAEKTQDAHEGAGSAPSESIETVRVRHIGERASRGAWRDRRLAAVWGGLAASVVTGLVLTLGPSGAEPPATGRAAGGPGLAPTDDPRPATTMSGTEIAAHIARAVSAPEVCGVRSTASLGEESATRVDRVAATADGPRVPLVRDPLTALHDAAVHELHHIVNAGPSALSTLDSQPDDQGDLLRVEFADDGAALLGGQVTEVRYLVDTSTWLPRGQELAAVSEQGAEYVLVSEMQWLGCDGLPVDDPR